MGGTILGLLVLASISLLQVTQWYHCISIISGQNIIIFFRLQNLPHLLYSQDLLFKKNAVMACPHCSQLPWLLFVFIIVASLLWLKHHFPSQQALNTVTWMRRPPAGQIVLCLRAFGGFSFGSGLPGSGSSSYQTDSPKSVLQSRLLSLSAYPTLRWALFLNYLNLSQSNPILWFPCSL